MRDDFFEEVVVVGIRIPFWSMVWFMTKWALACVPAAIILFALAGVVLMLVAALLGLDPEALLPMLSEFTGADD